MAELEKTNKPKRKLSPKIINKVDTTPTDVLQWAQEGRELYFDDGEGFLELPGEVYQALPLSSKTRYDIVKAHEDGNDVVADATDGIKGFKLPFNVRPDAPNRQLKVEGKDPKFDYHWARPDKYAYHLSEGWVVDHDPRTKTEFEESCDYKTVGGQNSPELILLKRPKEVSNEKRKERKAQRDASVLKAQGKFKEAAESIEGIKAVVDTDNGIK